MILAPRDIMALEPVAASVIDLYIATFCPRTDLYVANGAGVVREPITRDVIWKASKHKYPVSAYLGYLAPDNMWRTHIAAVDFDRDDGAEQAMALARWLQTQHCEAIVAHSRRGAHLWLVLGCNEAGLPPLVGEARRFLRSALTTACGPEVANDPKTEIFPKDGTDLAVGALRLPGMVHQKTHLTYPVVTADGEILDGMRAILSHLLLAPYPVVRAIAGPPTGSAKRDKGAYKFRRPASDLDNTSASSALQMMGVENARPGITVKCPKHEDRRRSLTIFRDDKRVYCGAPACLLHGDGHGVGSIALSKMVEGK